MKKINSKIRNILFIIFISIILFFIYSPAINSPFVFDDKNNIESNNLLLVKEVSAKNIKNILSSQRPVSVASFALNYYIHGLSPSLFRITNIFIHIFTTFILFLVIDETIHILFYDNIEPYKWLPMISAFLWSVHPLQIQSVTYIVQRMNSLAGMFMLLSLFLYIKARISFLNRSRIILFSGALFSALAAIGSKPNAVMLPFGIIVYNFIFLNEKYKLAFKNSRVLIISFMIFLFFLIIGNFLPEINLNNLYEKINYNRILVESRVIIFYISLILFPHPYRLNIDHDIDISFSVFNCISTSASIISIIFIILLAFFLRKKNSILSFGIFWFFLNHIVESTVMPIDLIFEHRNYIPSMMLIFSGVFIEMSLVRKKYLKFIILWTTAIVWSFWTYQRNEVWQSGLSIWQDSVMKSPNKARPHESLAYYLEKEGKIDDSLNHYERSVNIDPNNSNTHNNVGRLYDKIGNIKSAFIHYEKAININPKYKEVYNNIGNMFYKNGNLDISIMYYNKALEIDSNYKDAHANLANALVALNKNDLAMIHYDKSIEIDPVNANYRYNKSILLLRIGKIKEAEYEIKKIISMKSDFKEAFNNLGIIYERTGRIEEAMESYKNALRIDPNFDDAKKNIDRILNTEIN